MQYRDDMSDEEEKQLLAEIDALDTAYAEAAAIDAAQEAKDDALLGKEEADERRNAAWEASLEYFNRYIAGDRK